jgi:tetratricopeptide (TPR) repeat protein
MDNSTETQRRRYPGSRPFSKNDEWVFFGRDSDIENLITKINVEKTIVLYGKSGLGKTSLLNAGVLTRLERRYLIIPLRFGTPAPGDIKHPLDILDQQLAELFSGESFLNNIEPEDISLWQHIKNLQISDPDYPTLLLVFDQFEELFTYSRGVDEFAEALADLLYNRMPKNFQRALRLAENTRATRLSNKELDLLERPIDAKVLMAIRSDRMGLLDRLSFYIPNILKSCYELKHLSQVQAQDAISLPAQREGQFQSEPFTYQPQALAKMLAYLTQNGDTPVESFQLQILCQYVEDNFVIRQKKTSVGSDDLGDLETIYHDFYDRTRKALGTEEEQRKAGLLIEEGLIFEKEMRRISLFEGQIESTYHIGPELLRKIADTHIIRREPRGGGYIYELSHDSLVAPILRAKKQRMLIEEKRKRAEERRKEEEKRRQKEEKKQKEKEEKLKLELAEQKAESERKRAEQEARSARRHRRLSRALGVLVLIVLGAGFCTYILLQKVVTEKQKVEAEILVRKALSFAREGELEVALEKIADARKLNRELESDLEDKAKELVKDANKLKAQELAYEGQQLAKIGEWKDAIEKFKEAKKANPDLDLDPKKETAKILVSNGQKLADKGHWEDAAKKFKDAKDLDQDLQINPEALAKALAGQFFLKEGEKLARIGRKKKAKEKFKTAKELLPSLDLDPNEYVKKF